MLISMFLYSNVLSCFDLIIIKVLIISSFAHLFVGICLPQPLEAGLLAIIFFKLRFSVVSESLPAHPPGRISNPHS